VIMPTMTVSCNVLTGSLGGSMVMGHMMRVLVICVLLRAS
jgi:hypothetical protein